MNKEGGIKFVNSHNYQMFECVRKDKQGGGLLIGAPTTLIPNWIKDGNNIVEALTIQIAVQNFNIRVTYAYGPQKYDNINKNQPQLS